MIHRSMEWVPDFDQQKLVKLDNASIFVPNALAFNAACAIQWGFDHC